MDLYCVSNKTWYAACRSEPRERLAASSVGNKVISAGALNKNDRKYSDAVDIFKFLLADLVAIGLHLQ